MIYSPSELESIFIEIILPKKSNLVIGCVYRHPSMSIDNFNKNFLTPLLEKLSKEPNKTIFLLGDFNIDLLKFDSCNNTKSFIDELSSNFLLPQILLPTRISRNSKTLIDNIFCNIPKFNGDAITANLTSTLSDHLPQLYILPRFFSNSQSNPKSNVFVHNWKGFDKNSFIQDFQSKDWTDIIHIQKGDVNLSLENYLSNIDLLVKSHAPLKKLNKSQIKFQQKPWITNGLQTSIKKKNKFFSKYINSKNPNTKYEFHQVYKKYRNMLSTLLKESKKNYYNSYFSENAKNIKNTWKGIKSIITLKSKDQETPKVIKENDAYLTEPKQIANAFNNFFCSVAPKIQDSINYSHKSFESFLPPLCQNTFFISPCSKEDVIDIITSLDSSKAIGPNSIPIKILKLLKNDISQHLSDIFNLSFSSGVFPDILKTAKIIPIHKKDSKLECTNYRPISLLSNLDKILEKLMHTRLMKFLEDEKILYHKQFGFRKNYSTAHAIISLIENIEKAIDNNQFACGVFVDLKKAFDTVDHNILLKKLFHYGFRGVSNIWFESYLKDRTQFVYINGHESDLQKINIGVPQGSVLGPLLFLIYINDLHNSIKFSTAFHFADDTGLLNVQNSIKTINKLVNYDLKQLSFWLNANKIALNVAKTEVILFKGKNKTIDVGINLKLSRKKLNLSSHVRYLGVFIDENLNWKYHVNAISSKLIKANAMLSKLRHFVSKEVLRTVYYAIFQSHINYNCVAWAQINTSVRINWPILIECCKNITR